jgi:hypothetical protein
MLSALATKISEEVRLGSGSTNTPEPEELKEVYPQKKDIAPVSPEFECVKPIRNPNRLNRTFHRYTAELWSIRAGKYGLCPVCKRAIVPREEITLFKKAMLSWAHFSHALDEARTLEKVATNFHYEAVY